MENLNATVGVYHTHDKAIEAVQKLEKEAFDLNKISIIGKADIVENHIETHSGEEAMEKGVAIGAVLGSILGILTGLSMITVPGLGVLYMSGALVGAVGGFSIGSASGGILGALMAAGVGKDGVISYQKHLEVGKYLVVIQGTEQEVHKAESLLNDTEILQLDKHI